MARSAPGVQRVAAILNFIADHPGQSFSLTDLVRALRLSRATCHALLTGLVEVGYLYRASDKNYVLGPALASIGRVAAQHASPLQVAQPEMRALADEFDAVCAAYFRDRDDIVVRERAASVSHVGFTTPAGTRLKLRPPFGSIFYAWRAEAEATAWIDAIEPSPTPEIHRQMIAGMAFLREHGYSVYVRNAASAAAERTPEQVFSAEAGSFPTSLVYDLHDDEQYPLISITAPVFELRGRIAFVLGLTGFPGRPVEGAAIRAIAARLTKACDRISHFITGRPPDDADLSD